MFLYVVLCVFLCSIKYLVRPYLGYYLNDINSEKFQEEVVNLVASKSKQSDVGGVTKVNKSMGSSLLWNMNYSLTTLGWRSTESQQSPYRRVGWSPVTSLYP